MIERDKSERKDKVRKNKKKLIVLLILAFILVLIAAACSTFFVLAARGKKAARTDDFNIDTGSVGIERGTPPVITDSGKTITYKGERYSVNESIVPVLLIGVDKEKMGLDKGVVGTAGQADTIAVMAYNTSSGEVMVIVVPRETMAEINTYDTHGNYLDIKKMQICDAYAYGDGGHSSCDNLISSVERLLFGIDIKHYLALDLDGIVALNDAIGGVEVTCLETIGRFSKGEKITLIGEDADHYVRDRRKDIVDADTYRRERQKQYMQAFAGKTISLVKKDFRLLAKMWSYASGYTVTDLSLDDVTYFSTIALRHNFNLSSFSTVPGEYSMGNKYAEYYVNEDELFELMLSTFYTKEN